MKKIIALTLSLVMAFTLLACSAEDKETTEDSGTEAIRIAVSIANFDNATASIFLASMKEYEERDAGIEVSYLNASGDAATQLSQIENMIASDSTDVVICMPVDGKQMSAVVKNCNENEIPLLSLNRTFEGCDSFIGADGVAAGTMQAETVVEMLEGKGNVAILCGIMGQENQYLRTDALKAVLDQNEGMNLVFEGTGEWKRDKGQQVVENWLSSGEQIDCILANNDEMAIGAALAVDAAGLGDEIIVAGIDGNPAGIESIAAGSMEFTIFQNIYEQGQIAFDTAKAIYNGDEVEAAYMIPWELVTLENYAEFE